VNTPVAALDRQVPGHPLPFTAPVQKHCVTPGSRLTTMLLELVRTKPSHLHLVLTCRGAPGELIEAADLVSELLPIKHPFERGIKARRGVGF
jgi:cob(I)alamin adenosyltransferase